ncbi:MAG: sodium-translocating pyrophosphatase [Chloroflexi bacterium]|nr:sodium-translocating pyrophosphatase [Chloroflexota bacterium]
MWTVPAAGIAAVLLAIYLARDVLSRDRGSEQMREVAGMILEGAVAFMKRQYRTIGMLAVVAALLLGVLLALLAQTDLNGDKIIEQAERLELGWRTAVAFLVGALASAVAGIIGMYISVKSNLRCAAAATRSLRGAVQVALRGGAVSGFLIVALSLLGVTGIFYAFGGAQKPSLAPFLIVGFGFGASFVALFSQLGGGIYTKAADMGADLVGKVEAGIPEDDPRNAAVIADLVGDNVGDCAGRGADLFESTAAENIGAMILGVAIYAVTNKVEWVLFPLVVRAFGLIATGVGVLSVRGSDKEDPMMSLNKGYFLAVILAVAGMALATNVMLGEGWVWYFLAGVVGIATSVAFVLITQYYTEYRYRPVKEIVRASRTGPATNAVSGVAVGFESTLSTAIVIGLALLLSFVLGGQADLPGLEGGKVSLFGLDVSTKAGLFGTAVATMGMLMTAAYILAMDTFGPITDNANGIIEMSGNPASARHVTDRLDAVGNTTKALTKGYAVGSAGLAAFLLFAAYLEDVEKITGVAFDAVNLAKVEVFVGGLLGVALVFLFSSLAIRAVGRAASGVIEEVRRQFRERPGIMQGTERPDFARCVDITTRAGLREMLAPGLVAVLMPVIVGVALKAEAVGAFLMVGTIGGILLATVLNNAGGAWDNAKKFIESGAMKGDDGQVVRKGTPIHAAAVVGDTIGDPFKDTAGPSLHVLVKLLSTITLVLAPIFV